MGRGFESHRAHPAHKARTLANRIVGFGSSLVAVLSPGEGVGVDLGVEQHLEGPVVLDAQLAVFLDVDLGKERLIAETPGGGVASVVDVSAVLQQVQRIVEVGAGVGVVAVVGFDAPVEVVEFGEDAVLFAFEDRQRDGVGVVSLHESVLFVFEPVAVLGESFEFVGFGGHESVELVVQHPGQGVALGGADLHTAVVVLDQLLDVFDEDRLSDAVGALGVPA
ncbi:hypothetical protein [Arthrobacter subterraneus]|uniref:hypothetical protein n=1 Tax=Arthrobacter subterraneus TaxID=335973 RepID=UPI001FE12012|nr:hypothetical protein [Arthrobacter subterraneus]